ncbi:MAG: PBSX family phage terminase large subunit [Gallionella sp.]|jgi:phage terminase large subunit
MSVLNRPNSADVSVNIPRGTYNAVYYPYFNNYSRTQIFFGGSGSGKSVFLAQRAIYDVMRGGRNYLICRQVGRTIRGSVFTELVKVIGAWGVSALFTINKTDMVITCVNGYQIVFIGLDDVEKIKSITPSKGSFTDLWIEEATETDKNTVKQLIKRQRGGSESVPKRITLSFNPVLKSHWIFDEYFSKIGWADNQTEYQSDELSILKTWYIHNAYLTADDKRDLTNETDQYFYNVYTLGNWGVLGNVIFTNWKVDDLTPMQAQFTNRRNGLDWGFAGDPAAVVVSHYDQMRKTIYIFDEIYERGLTNPQLAEKVIDKIGKDWITCDSAEPKSIVEVQGDGVEAGAAVKGKDSVTFGIQWLKQQTIIVDKKCINAQNEFSQYHWKEDAGGNAMPIPVDKNNHLIDALRYAYERDMDDTPLFVGRY